MKIGLLQEKQPLSQFLLDHRQLDIDHELDTGSENLRSDPTYAYQISKSCGKGPKPRDHRGFRA